jgi:hypothetical protein
MASRQISPSDGGIAASPRWWSKSWGRVASCVSRSSPRRCSSISRDRLWLGADKGEWGGRLAVVDLEKWTVRELDHPPAGVYEIVSDLRSSTPTRSSIGTSGLAVPSPDPFAYRCYRVVRIEAGSPWI